MPGAFIVKATASKYLCRMRYTDAYLLCAECHKKGHDSVEADGSKNEGNGGE